jgi:cysteine desulfurase
MRPLYFDHNATTPLLPEVVDAMLPFLTTHFGNPSSTHEYGRTAKNAIEQARAQVAQLVNAPTASVIFTSGGTEATGLALRGVLERAERRGLILSTVEHPATSAVAQALSQRGVDVRRVGVDQHGLLRRPALEHALTSPTALVTVIHGHNETGVVQSLAALAALAHRAGALLHADASQSAGKVPLDVSREGVDLLTLAGHKLYAPKGVGALVALPHVALSPQQVGAGHEGPPRRHRERRFHRRLRRGVRGGCARPRGAARALAHPARSPRAATARGLPQGRHRGKGRRATSQHALHLPAGVLRHRAAGAGAGPRGLDGLGLSRRVRSAARGVARDGLRPRGGAGRLTLGRSTTDDDVQHAVALLRVAAQSTRTVLG